MKKAVTSNSDSGTGSLRQAIIDINSSGDEKNTIEITIQDNKTIFLTSDLPVIKKNIVIISTRHQTIDGKGEYLCSLP